MCLPTIVIRVLRVRKNFIFTIDTQISAASANNASHDERFWRGSLKTNFSPCYISLLLFWNSNSVSRFKRCSSEFINPRRLHTALCTTAFVREYSQLRVIDYEFCAKPVIDGIWLPLTIHPRYIRIEMCGLSLQRINWKSKQTYVVSLSHSYISGHTRKDTRMYCVAQPNCRGD